VAFPRVGRLGDARLPARGLPRRAPWVVEYDGGRTQTLQRGWKGNRGTEAPIIPSLIDRKLKLEIDAVKVLVFLGLAQVELHH